MNRIFLLEDHSWFRRAIATLLEREQDLEVVGEAGSLTEARAEVSDNAQQIDLALIDLLLPDGIGTELIRELRRAKPDPTDLGADRDPRSRSVHLGAGDGGGRDALQGFLLRGDPHRH